MRIYTNYEDIWNKFKFDCSDDNFKTLTYNETNGKLLITANTPNGVVHDLYSGEDWQFLRQAIDLQEALNYIK